jgi:predicted MFS family arabinose efflux permease
MFREVSTDPIRPFHIKNIIVNGVGVLSDSYNLYAISLVFFSITGYLHASAVDYSFLTASGYIGAGFGAILFGVIADRIGRKPMYGIDLALIFLGSAAQFFTTSYSFLFISRLIMGFGIGGDYVMSPVIMAENSNAKDRGKLMATTFSIMYLIGAVLAAFVVQVAGTFISPAEAWRVELAFGAVPALFVIYYRRKIPETYRFKTRVQGDSDSNFNVSVKPEKNIKLTKDRENYATRFLRSLPIILAGSVLWVLYDAYSSTFTIFGPITIAANLGLSPVGFTYVAVFLAGLPGTIISLLLIDRVGRKKLVVIGYLGVFVALLLYSILLVDPGIFGIPPSDEILGGFIGIAAALGMTFYMFNYLFSAVGPATIIGGTVIVPELIPTKVRASGQALNVFIDRIAAATVITLFPVLLSIVGLGFMIFVYALIAVGSSILLYYAFPEAKGKTLEELAREPTESNVSGGSGS